MFSPISPAPFFAAIRLVWVLGTTSDRTETQNKHLKRKKTQLESFSADERKERHLCWRYNTSWWWFGRAEHQQTVTNCVFMTETSHKNRLFLLWNYPLDILFNQTDCQCITWPITAFDSRTSFITSNLLGKDKQIKKCLGTRDGFRSSASEVKSKWPLTAWAANTAALLTFKRVTWRSHPRPPWHQRLISLLLLHKHSDLKSLQPQLQNRVESHPRWVERIITATWNHSGMGCSRTYVCVHWSEVHVLLVT